MGIHKQLKRDKNSSGYKLLYIFAIAVVLSAILYSVKVGDDKNFEKNKAITSGIVKKVLFDKYTAEFVSYERYLFEYEYNVEDQKLSKVFECKPREISKYFDEIPKRGDSISIAFNTLQPQESKPYKIVSPSK